MTKGKVYCKLDMCVHQDKGKCTFFISMTEDDVKNSDGIDCPGYRMDTEKVHQHALNEALNGSYFGQE